MSNFLQPMNCSTPDFSVLHCLLEFAQTHVHWVSDAIQPSHSLLPSSLPTLNLSQHQDLSQWVNFCIRWPKYWSFSFSISPSNEYSGLISFRIDWFDLFTVQGTLKSLLQHHSLDVHQNLKIIALKFENHFFRQHFCAVWVSVFTHFSFTALYFRF